MYYLYIKQIAIEEYLPVIPKFGNLRVGLLSPSTLPYTEMSTYVIHQSYMRNTDEIRGLK